MRVFVVTVSDRCSKGEAEDRSGPRIFEILEAHCARTNQELIIAGALVPDEIDRIRRVVTQQTDRTDPAFPTLILLSGGTGFAARDVTPEALRPIFDKEAPNIVSFMLHNGLQQTKYAWLSRAVAGIRKRSIVIAMPGSPKAVEECLAPLLDAGLEHAVQLASGEELEQSHPTATSVVPSTSRSPLREGSERHSQPSSDKDPSPLLPHLSAVPALIPYQNPVQASFLGSVNQPSVSLNQLTPRRSRVDVSPPRSGRASSPQSTHRAPSVGVASRDRISTYPMVPMAESLSIIQRVVDATGLRRPTRLPVLRAVGCVLAEPLISEFDQPPFPASCKDGYAVVASDGPGLYPVVGALTAGSRPDGFVLGSRQICRVNTGGPVPGGSDAVVQVEDTKVIDISESGEEASVLIMSRVQSGHDIRPVGCDVRAGQVILSAGTEVHAPEVGLAMSVGATSLSVLRKPVVAILSTGDELEEPQRRREAGTPNPGVPSYGKIFDSNKGMLLAAVMESGYEVLDAGIAKDNMDDTREVLRRALQSADIIITSGGVSMGEVDCVKNVLLELGATIHFGRVNMKPGKPTTFASLGDKLIFALPGNPVSAMVCYHLFVTPALRAISGKNPEPLIVQARLEQTFKLDPERPEYHRCFLRRIESAQGQDKVFVASSTGIQASHRLLSMSGANGMVVLPCGEGVLEKDSFVDVIVIGNLV